MRLLCRLHLHCIHKRRNNGCCHCDYRQRPPRPKKPNNHGDHNIPEWIKRDARSAGV